MLRMCAPWGINSLDVNEPPQYPIFFLYRFVLTNMIGDLVIDP